jgi:catechol 2,3-dioxygenase-like lactoylglutathione lyase family enzyme
MTVGEFRSFVLDVRDLEEGERFWRAILGWELQFSAFNGTYSRIGKKGTASLLLQLVPEPKTEHKNRAHVDVTVDDVASAVPSSGSGSSLDPGAGLLSGAGSDSRMGGSHRSVGQ